VSSYHRCRVTKVVVVVVEGVVWCKEKGTRKFKFNTDVNVYFKRSRDLFSRSLIKMSKSNLSSSQSTSAPTTGQASQTDDEYATRYDKQVHHRDIGGTRAGEWAVVAILKFLLFITLYYGTNLYNRQTPIASSR